MAHGRSVELAEIKIPAGTPVREPEAALACICGIRVDRHPNDHTPQHVEERTRAERRKIRRLGRRRNNGQPRVL
jgi:hypothetical protein